MDGRLSGGHEILTKIPSILAKPGCVVPDGFEEKELPACTMGICFITGTSRDITRGAHYKLVRTAVKAGYVPDYSYGYSMEYY